MGARQAEGLAAVRTGPARAAECKSAEEACRSARAELASFHSAAGEAHRQEHSARAAACTRGCPALEPKATQSSFLVLSWAYPQDAERIHSQIRWPACCRQACPFPCALGTPVRNG